MFKRFALLAWFSSFFLVGSVFAQAAPVPGSQPEAYPPPGQYPQQGQFPPGQYPPGQYPPGRFPAQQPPAYPQQPVPQGYYPGGAYPPGAYAQDPNAAYAQPQPVAVAPLVSSVDGVIQLGLATALVQYASIGVSSENPVLEISRSAVNWGLAHGPLVIDGGYGLTPQLLIGAQLQVGGASVSDPAQVPGFNGVKVSSFNFTIGPKVEYLFMPESKLNPFAGALVTVAVASATNPVFKESSTTFHFTARGGLHYFLFDQLSLDPVFYIGALVGSGSENLSNPPANAPPAPAVDLSFSGFELGVSLGLSLWIK